MQPSTKAEIKKLSKDLGIALEPEQVLVAKQETPKPTIAPTGIDLAQRKLSDAANRIVRDLDPLKYHYSEITKDIELAEAQNAAKNYTGLIRTLAKLSKHPNHSDTDRKLITTGHSDLVKANAKVISIKNDATLEGAFVINDKGIIDTSLDFIQLAKQQGYKFTIEQAEPNLTISIKNKQGKVMKTFSIPETSLTDRATKLFEVATVSVSTSKAPAPATPAPAGAGKAPVALNKMDLNELKTTTQLKIKKLDKQIRTAMQNQQTIDDSGYFDIQFGTHDAQLAMKASEQKLIQSMQEQRRQLSQSLEQTANYQAEKRTNDAIDYLKNILASVDKSKQTALTNSRIENAIIDKDLDRTISHLETAETTTYYSGKVGIGAATAAATLATVGMAGVAIAGVKTTAPIFLGKLLVTSAGMAGGTLIGGMIAGATELTKGILEDEVTEQSHARLLGELEKDLYIVGATATSTGIATGFLGLTNIRFTLPSLSGLFKARAPKPTATPAAPVATPVSAAPAAPAAPVVPPASAAPAAPAAPVAPPASAVPAVPARVAPSTSRVPRSQTQFRLESK